MTSEASQEIQRRENLAAQFISQYNEKRNANEDPVLRLSYAVSELLQIVVWLRIEVDRLSESKKVIPTITRYICTCGHSRNIHLANDGICCSNSNQNFDCDCLGFEER